MTDLITCERVGYRQQGVDILTDINWRIERGQHWAVLGRMAPARRRCCELPADICGRRAAACCGWAQELIDLSELRRSIGWISSGMIADIPPTRHRAGNGRHRPARADSGFKRFPEFGPTDADFADAAAELARLGCESLADKPFGVLSQGERQQVLIARARMARPLLLVLDEPCAGMDPGVRERFSGVAQRAA